jgi:hypothetical protein
MAYDHDERMMEAKLARRFKAEGRWLARLEKLVPAAEAIIGQLCREGRTIFYINGRTANGSFNGRVHEFTNSGAATDFAIRNHYV